MNDNTLRVIEVDINDVLPNRFQPRLQFEEEEILELSDSIKEHGVIQPLIVRQIGNKYEIIAGERRYKASVLAGKETIPVIVRSLNDKESAEVALIENVQRKNLTPIEEALSYKKILDMGYINQTELALKLGKSQPSIANKIRLLNLSDEVQEALLENKISERHARSLLKIGSIQAQNEMLNRIINERLTVRSTDEEIAKLLSENSNLKSKEESEKIEEKGDVMSMDSNNIQQTNNIFDMYSSTPNVPVESLTSTPAVEAPAMESVSSAPTIEMPTMEQVTNTPVIEVPAMEPVSSAPTIEMPTMEQVTNTPAIEVPAMKSISSVPTIEMPPVEQATNTAVVEAPVMNQVESTINQQNISSTPVFELPTIPQSVEIPSTEMPQNVQNVTSTPVSGEEQIPVTAPIEESTTSVNTESPANQDLPATQPNMPEPIIITDYNKQYDPVMPNAPTIEIPKADFKEIINIIRNCSNQIEQMGYNLELEEYDLQDIYQVVFKVNKN